MKQPKSKVLVLRDYRDSRIAQLAMAMAWACRSSSERCQFEVQARDAIEIMCRAQGGRA